MVTQSIYVLEDIANNERRQKLIIFLLCLGADGKIILGENRIHIADIVGVFNSCSASFSIISNACHSGIRHWKDALEAMFRTSNFGFGHLASRRSSFLPRNTEMTKKQRKRLHFKSRHGFSRDHN